MKEFNQLLKELGITRKEFAKHIGITYDSMNAMLYKKNLPKWAKSALLIYNKLNTNKHEN
jgi:DNA-binding XRE family transcriptional regulator